MFKTALQTLSDRFSSLPWNFQSDPSGETHELISQWLGRDDEELMVCVFRGKNIHEPFHRQEFFFLNYAWENEFFAYSTDSGTKITLHENDCYIGQPFNGYALQANAKTDLTIIGVLVRKDIFIREFLPTISSDSDILRFFLAPTADAHSNGFIHLSIPEPACIRELLKLMVMIYGTGEENHDAILKPLALSLVMMIAGEYQKQKRKTAANDALPMKLQNYIRMNAASVTLQSLSHAFGYHPAYLSALLKQETGKTFSAHVLEYRMQNACLLLKNTDLSIEEISPILGYSNKSNFHKAFREYFHCTPREYRITPGL